MSRLESTTRKNNRASCFSAAVFQRPFVQPPNTTYLAWQKQLKKFLMSSTRKRGFSKNIRKSRRFNRYKRKLKMRRASQNQQEQLATKQMIELLEQQPITEPDKNSGFRLELITILKQFYERKGLYEQIEATIPDRRNQELTVYSKQSLMMSALMIFLLRMSSGNGFDTKSHDDDDKYCRRNVAKFIDAPEDCVPVIKTIEKFLRNLEVDSINNLMIAFFKDLQKSKFFKQHPNIMPGDFFLLAADCVHTHTYEHLHYIDKYGQNGCDCCLKRIYNRGTEKEKVKWQHQMLVFSFVFLGGLKIPIYRHCIRARQVVNMEDTSDDVHKQECELVALKAALPIIREAFPRMKIVLLLDGLYANRPVIRLASEQRCGYIIVRKDGCLTTVGSDCNGQAKLADHKSRTKVVRGRIKGWTIEQKYEWFNAISLETSTTKKIGTKEEIDTELSTNILRLFESRTNGGETKSYKCEWLFSQRLSAKNCQRAASHARLRWEEEDLFNSLKNRGYNLKHDFSRNPYSCFNWQGIALFAFGIFELFRFSETVKRRGAWPEVMLAEKLQAQLLQRPTEELFSERHLKVMVQFRYNFEIEVIAWSKTHEDIPERLLETG